MYQCPEFSGIKCRTTSLNSKFPKIYRGLNAQSEIVADGLATAADDLQKFRDALEEFKSQNIVDGMGTEIYDTMLEIYDTKNKKNFYESGMAGLVGYDETKQEYLVGPFNIDYERMVHIPGDGTQNENAGEKDKNLIIFNSITDAEVYGLNSAGEEVKINDWEFVYTDVDYDVKTGEATRVKETEYHDMGDTAENIYPYPEENFYIRFKFKHMPSN